MAALRNVTYVTRADYDPVQVELYNSLFVMDCNTSMSKTHEAELSRKVEILGPNQRKPTRLPDYMLWEGDVEQFLGRLGDNKERFDLVITSPPYNIGKAYERRMSVDRYVDWQKRVIAKVVKRLSPTGSLCWQVGNFVEDNTVLPLDLLFHPILTKLGLKLRNRIVWHFGHGLHCRRRFSGRYEVVMWYTASDDYVFNLDAVRVPSKYPGKKAFKGPRQGQYSSNPLGKNPEDVWEIPNVKANHIEKTIHPCQFPVGLVERLVLSLTNRHDLVFDPFAGVGSAGVAAAIHERRFWGCEPQHNFVKVARQRISDALEGRAQYRPHDKPLYDHTQSKLSLKPVQE